MNFIGSTLLLAGLIVTGGGPLTNSGQDLTDFHRLGFWAGIAGVVTIVIGAIDKAKH